MWKEIAFILPEWGDISSSYEGDESEAVHYIQAIHRGDITSPVSSVC